MLGESGAKMISEVLRGNRSLTELDLRCNEWKWERRDGLNDYFWLITGNNFRDLEIGIISEALKYNSTLTKLGLSCNEWLEFNNIT